MSLFEAVSANNYELVKTMIDEGADVKFSNEDGLTALYIASDNGFKEICALLIAKGADVNSGSVTIKGETTVIYNPLIGASYKGYKEICSLLIENGADVNVKRSMGGTTPLIIATRQGHKEICSLLIEKGADMYSKNSALYNAVGNGHKEICEILIANGADVNNVEFNMFGSSPQYTLLMIASFKGFKEICQILIANGANVNAKDSIGWTALMIATMWNKKDICELLIEKGADIKAEGTITAYKIASMKGYEALQDLLNEKGDLGYSSDLD